MQNVVPEQADLISAEVFVNHFHIISYIFSASQDTLESSLVNGTQFSMLVVAPEVQFNRMNL